MADEAIQINTEKQPTAPASAAQNAGYFGDRTLASLPRAGYVFLFCVPFFLASCNDDKIEVYRIPKENRIVAMEEGPLAPQPPTSGKMGKTRWLERTAGVRNAPW